ncbi:hypothetical protein PGUG_04499 [Meyerozyma guilliermondii ATCC 6260]|uniref:Urea active transporter n=1 Tax=Meyerozyma guilliermondii (strain ATCC 6260 / CBS 566 / DSM 6381 / JCM 1539 / NBRC 10279 / NRRL Y-324) TaxID=294746 RepID=A5DMJ8_PICGU|nr:uncharacterized protein PGUG_04499 [Meyerozyma guilliermondii ATCC 6260]EDK40401.2 hypothetical protein PGUG_04499 [Meyerozyma guilliermondii ATCC 6260]
MYRCLLQRHLKRILVWCRGMCADNLLQYVGTRNQKKGTQSPHVPGSGTNKIRRTYTHCLYCVLCNSDGVLYHQLVDQRIVNIFSHHRHEQRRSYCVVSYWRYHLHFDGRHQGHLSLPTGLTPSFYTVLCLHFYSTAMQLSDIVGSPGALWDLLVEASERRPIAGNASGSLLTFNSVQGGLFGLVLFGAGFAAACDSQLFQKAIAADPKYLVRGYILGGLAWFSLPFCLSTTMGLAAAGLETHPSFPTFPDLMSAEEIGAGLVLPYAAQALMGRSGVAMVLTMIFMAVTAAFSSETIAISAMVTHDVYKAYVNPDAKGGRLVLVSHATVIAFGIVTVALGIGLAHAGFDVSFITTASGIIVNVNIVAMVLTLYWRKMSGFAYSVGTVVSTMIALAVWMAYTVSQSGYISLATLSTNEALAAGNTVAVGCPLIVIPILVFLKPADFAWETWLSIKQDDNTEFD